jgi:hypothetical protein
LKSLTIPVCDKECNYSFELFLPYRRSGLDNINIALADKTISQSLLTRFYSFEGNNYSLVVLKESCSKVYSILSLLFGFV